MEHCAEKITYQMQPPNIHLHRNFTSLTLTFTPPLKILIKPIPPLHRLLPHSRLPRHQSISHQKSQRATENLFLRELGTALNRGTGFELERVCAAEE
jgi:hypothetical protein